MSQYDKDYRSSSGDWDAYRRPGDWLVGTARRNPEAFLVLAAGLALLMRSGWRGSGSYDAETYGSTEGEFYGYDADRGEDMERSGNGRERGRMRAMREGVS